MVFNTSSTAVRAPYPALPRRKEAVDGAAGFSFVLFLFYLVVVLVRPIEFFDLEALGQMRPMLWLWLASFMVSIAHALANSRMAAKPAHVMLMLFLVMTIMLSQLKQGWAGGAILSALDFSTSAGLFALVVLNVTNLRRLKLTCAAVVVSVLWVAGTGAFSYHTGQMVEKLVLGQWVGGNDVPEELVAELENTVPAQDTSGLRLWRVRGLGFMSDPNDLAQAMVMVLPLLWGMARQGHRFTNLLFVWLPCLFLAYAVYLTHSRGAVLGLASLFFFALRERLGLMRTVLAVGCVGAGALVVGLGGGRGFSSEEESAGDRITAWYEGIQMLKNNLLLGVGYGNFLDHHHLTAHNSFVLCFAELGLVGYFFWTGLIVLVYRGLGKVIAEGAVETEERKLAILLRSALVGFLTCAWFLSRTYQPTLYLLLGLATATWFCWAKQATSKREYGQRGRLSWAPPTLAAMVISITAVYGFIVMDSFLVK